MKSADLSQLIRSAVTSLLLLIPLGFAPLQLNAVQIENNSVAEENGIYRIKIRARLDAPAKYVREVLTDYKHIYRLNPSITENSLLPSPKEGIVRVRTRIVDCIFLVCLDIIRVEDVEVLSGGLLRTTIVPSLSNFRYGITDWRIQTMHEQSKISYQSSQQPDFYIPPLIGTYFAKQQLQKNVLYSLEMLECLAKIREELDWNPELQMTGGIIESGCRTNGKPDQDTP